MKDKSVGIPAEKTGKLGNWGIGNYAQYKYNLFDKKERMNGPWYGKSFMNIHEAPPELFSAIDDYKPSGIVPFLIGKTEGKKDQLIFDDIINRHILIAGMTRSGKTNFMQAMLVSLLHYSHPEYLKVVVLDPKAAAFKDMSKVINVVNFSMEEIAEAIIYINKIMRDRIEITKQPGLPEDAKKINEFAYKHQLRSKLMPYIVIIFDEFAEFSMWAKKNNPEAMNAIKSIAALGLGLGIHLVFATQSPYAAFIKGYVSANFEKTICFKVRNFTQENLVLGKKRKGDRSAEFLNTGEFLIKENGRYVLYKAVLCGNEAMINAANNLTMRGFNYKLF